MTTLRAEKDAQLRQREQEQAALRAEKDAIQHTLQQRVDQLEELLAASVPREEVERLLALERAHSSLLQAMSVVASFEHFSDVTFLAKGSCGIVMRGRVRSAVVSDLVEHVAVKMMTNLGMSSTREARRSFEAEYAILAGLRHPGIAQVYRVFEDRPTAQMIGFVDPR